MQIALELRQWHGEILPLKGWVALGLLVSIACQREPGLLIDNVISTRAVTSPQFVEHGVNFVKLVSMTTSENGQLLLKNLIKLLTAHRCSPVVRDNWTFVRENTYPAFKLELAQHPEEARLGGFTVQIALDNSTIIEEEIAALGHDEHTRTKDGLQQFAATMLHPALSAAGTISHDKAVSEEVWHHANGAGLTAWIGDLSVRQSDGVDMEVPVDWLQKIERSISDEHLEAGYHWVSLYCSKLKSGELKGFAKLDNRHWSPGWDAQAGCDWHDSPGYYGVRLFIILHAAS